MIGKRLSIEPSTAPNHVFRIVTKRGVGIRVQAAARAVREGLV